MKKKYIIKTKIRRFITSFLKLSHPTSYPYISGDAFRSLAQHVLDESFDIVPKSVLNNEIIFVRNNHLEEFFKHYLPKIKNSFILISHNDDIAVKESYVEFLNEKIIHWFCLNANFTHSKVTPIPIGVQNMVSCKHNEISIIDSCRKNTPAKDTSILYGFTVGSNLEEREDALQYIKQHPLAVLVQEKDISKYFAQVTQHSFIVSPPGIGIDCHRTWEALYLKTIPIVKESELTLFFKKNGVPMICVKKWSDILQLNKETLSDIYNNASFENPRLWMYYWIQLIHDKRE